jgi:SAM-dependent methyltransferase
MMSRTARLNAKTEDDRVSWSQRFWNTLSQQIRNPSGWLGYSLGHLMAWEHRPLMHWGIERLEIGETDDVLEVGCGGGMAIAYMSTLTNGSITGIDYSDTMVRQARARNRQLVDSGRVVIEQGNVADLQFDDDTFDSAIAIESFFFWPEPIHCLRELRRVLKPRGKLGVLVDSSKESPKREELAKAAAVLGVEFYSGSEIVNMMQEAGFVDTRYEALPDKGRGWLFVRGKKG